MCWSGLPPTELKLYLNPLKSTTIQCQTYYFFGKRKKRSDNVLELQQFYLNKPKRELFMKWQVPTRHLQKRLLTAWHIDSMIDGSPFLFENVALRKSRWHMRSEWNKQLEVSTLINLTSLSSATNWSAVSNKAAELMSANNLATWQLSITI